MFYGIIWKEENSAPKNLKNLSGISRSVSSSPEASAGRGKMTKQSQELGILDSEFC